MKNTYLVEVFMEADKLFEKEAKDTEEVLEVLNCFDWKHEYMRFRVTDDYNNVVPHYYYDKWTDSIVY